MFHDFINLFYPKTCNCCERELSPLEQVLCTYCIHELPLTNYQLDNDNPAKKVFDARLEIIAAYSLLIFKKKGMVQQLLHRLKYKGQFEISCYLGDWTGEILKNNQQFLLVEVVIPVPLHKKRLKERGYNQVEGFGKAIAKYLKADYMDDVLLKKEATKKQAFKNRMARTDVLQQSFLLNNPGRLRGKHILLVDDILTTGATLEACGNCLKDIDAIKISITTMAITV